MKTLYYSPPQNKSCSYATGFMDSHLVRKIEYSLHMHEDVKHHSLLNNYWCYLYERQVKYYKHQTSNMKSLCKSFADRANLLHFTSVLLSSHEISTVSHESKFVCLSQQPLLLSASSVEQAIELKEFISSSDDSSLTSEWRLFKDWNFSW